MEINWQEELRKNSIREIAMISLAQQGALTAGNVLTTLAINSGKLAYQGLNVRGGKANSPVINSLRIADRPPMPACAVAFPTEMIVFDETLYASLETEPKALRAARALRSGFLIVGTRKDPEQVGFPFDFEGTVATVDALRITFEETGLNPPPYGTTLLGLHAAATGFASIDSLCEAIANRLPGKAGERSVIAARRAYENAKIKENVAIRGSSSREDAGKVMTLASAPEFMSIDAPPLPGVSEGNLFIWRELLPVWNREKCRCATQCPLVDFCPEGVINYRQNPLAYGIDYEYCRGCGICAHECLGGAITMQSAVEVYGR